MSERAKKIGALTRQLVSNKQAEVDSDLVLKWIGAILALGLIALRVVGPMFGLKVEHLPGLETILAALGLSGGGSLGYLVKRKQDQGAGE
ncbi:hypothetical protein KKB55_15560 [Myxococcota bacterium]|nr:hypothetical protein [Myxococcota bacterium]MBU1899156.1 hypothetical protein [Myxococcota bacterium]